MTDQSGSSHLQVLFEAALRDYERQTDIALTKHPLAERLQNCNSIESVTDVLHEQAQAFSEFRGKDKFLKSLKKVVSVLHKLSAAANFGQDIGLNFPHVKAIHTGLGVLLSAVKGSIDSYDALAELLESIEHFLDRLDIYTKIPSTLAMTKIVVKILVELLSTLALATKQIQQGKLKKIAKELFGGEKDVEAVLRRLDRLTEDEARIAAAQTLEVVCGLIQSMRVVMDDGKASADHVMKALEIMQQLVNDQNKSKRDNLQQDIFRWLSPPDTWKNHHNACESRHRGSAAWFIQGNTFLEWKASDTQSPLLWVHGKPGAGKSVLCSAIIEDVDAMRKAGLASLAYFYCDFREDQKKDLRGLLSSLLVQLCHQSDSYCDILSKLYSEHAKGLRSPSDDALAGCLTDLLKLPGLAPAYLILDALDECPNIPVLRSPRAKVLNLIEELIKLQIPNLRICVTSRLEADIKNVLDRLTLRRVSLHDERGQKGDIEDYIEWVINTHPNNKKWKAEHKQLVIDVLTQKNDGMFRWVYCQLDYICGLIPARIRHALAELPETLEETYKRTLREINKAEWKFAHRLFQFVSVASRPLRAEELADLLAFDFEAGSIPKFHEGWRLENPVDAVLSTCSSLLSIVDGGYRHPFGTAKVIEFSHFSVKEFLTSDRLAESSDINFRRYHISTTPAHTLVAQACLGILLHLDKDVVTTDTLNDLPLIKYAAENWADHARLKDVSQNVEDGMKQLFDPRRRHLEVCVWIHDPARPALPLWSRDLQSERPSPPQKTPLHYAAIWGLQSIVEFLVIEHQQNVHSQDVADNATPLHLASEKGHAKVTCFLLDHGADLTAKNKEGKTSLHLASEAGQLEVVGMLIDRGANVTTQTMYGWTPLHLASERGQLEVAAMLIEHGADLTAKNKYGWTPLLLASQEGHAEVAAMLIERGADVMAKNSWAQTPLHMASEGGQLKVVSMLIQRGADVTTQNKDNLTSLHLASQRGHVEVVAKLIEHGADATARNKDSSTPLHLALQEGRPEVACMLIEHGADVMAQRWDGSTPLYLASEGGLLKVVDMLIERGADVMTRKLDGSTPLYVASQMGQVEVATKLIERGANTTAQNQSGWTPLHVASKRGQVEVVGMLIKHGADVSVQTNYGWTPLHAASKEGQLEVAKMLIDHGADVTAQDENGWTPLHRASQRGQVDVVGILIKHGSDATTQDKDGLTPLHLASQEGKLDAAVILIERGADLAAECKLAMTPLHLASQEGHLKVAIMLIERGADVTTRNKYGLTPLHLASQGGQAEVLSMLMEHGADVTAQNEDDLTPLHLASQEGQPRAVTMLIDSGADLTAQDKKGATPLHLALQRRQVEVACILIEHGADITAQNEDGSTPLHLASRDGQLKASTMLIERGADVASQDKKGETPLYLALQWGHVEPEVVAILIEHGADVTVQTEGGSTSLHLMSREGHLKMATMLIEHGADVTAQNKFGWTPLHFASERGQLEVAGMLVEHGADITTQNEDGSTPLHLASLEGQLEVATMLIERGADVTAQNNYGATSLHLALEKKKGEIVYMLIERGANTTAQNKYGWTPLHYASYRGQLEIARVLVEHGADITAQNEDGFTPLHLASLEGQLKVAIMLIERCLTFAPESPFLNEDRLNRVTLKSRAAR